MPGVTPRVIRLPIPITDVQTDTAQDILASPIDISSIGPIVAQIQDIVVAPGTLILVNAYVAFQNNDAAQRKGTIAMSRSLQGGAAAEFIGVDSGTTLDFIVPANESVLGSVSNMLLATAAGTINLRINARGVGATNMVAAATDTMLAALIFEAG